CTAPRDRHRGKRRNAARDEFPTRPCGHRRAAPGVGTAPGGPAARAHPRAGAPTAGLDRVRAPVRRRTDCPASAARVAAPLPPAAADASAVPASALLHPAPPAPEKLFVKVWRGEPGATQGESAAASAAVIHTVRVEHHATPRSPPEEEPVRIFKSGVIDGMAY